MTKTKRRILLILAAHSLACYSWWLVGWAVVFAITGDLPEPDIEGIALWLVFSPVSVPWLLLESWWAWMVAGGSVFDLVHAL
jgi:hypothetical protein